MRTGRFPAAPGAGGWRRCWPAPLARLLAGALLGLQLRGLEGCRCPWRRRCRPAGRPDRRCCDGGGALLAAALRTPCPAAPRRGAQPRPAAPRPAPARIEGVRGLIDEVSAAQAALDSTAPRRHPAGQPG
ncbi:hypothetical protein ACFFMP_15640 [Pseudoroseomonas cervicalis]|uniref:hypothetical protein n=1 Tax=Teichococcus cervicalis TaxID=204525 RepID=UPI0035ECE5C8